MRNIFLSLILLAVSAVANAVVVRGPFDAPAGDEGRVRAELVANAIEGAGFNVSRTNDGMPIRVQVHLWDGRLFADMPISEEAWRTGEFRQYAPMFALLAAQYEWLSVPSSQLPLVGGLCGDHMIFDATTQVHGPVPWGLYGEVLDKGNSTWKVKLLIKVPKQNGEAWSQCFFAKKFYHYPRLEELNALWPGFGGAYWFSHTDSGGPHKTDALFRFNVNTLAWIDP